MISVVGVEGVHIFQVDGFGSREREEVNIHIEGIILESVMDCMSTYSLMLPDTLLIILDCCLQETSDRMHSANDIHQRGQCLRTP